MPYKEKGRDTYRGKIQFEGKTYTKRFEKKQQAKDWEAEKRKSLKSNRRQTLTVSLHEAGTKYLKYCEGMRYSPITVSNKKKAVKELLSITGNVALEEIGPETILQDVILKQKTAALANERRKHLHSFFEYCRKFHGLRFNPVTPIEKIPQDRKPQPVPTHGEFARMLLQCRDRQDRNLLIVMEHCGARRSELFRLTFSDDVDFAGRQIRVGNRKNKRREMRYRWIPMNDELFNALQDQFKRRLPQSDFVFQNRDERHPNYGGRFTARRKFMKGMAKLAEVKNVGFHGVRRYFASKLVEKGVDLKSVQDLLGHAVISTTDKYVFQLKADIKSAVNQISEGGGAEKAPEKKKKAHEGGTQEGKNLVSIGSPKGN